jgi:integrase
MLNFQSLPLIDFRAIGRHMSRERYQRGSLKKIGKTQKMWRGRWHVYVKGPNDAEKVCKRERILGPVSDLTKAQAQQKLDALIEASTGQISGAMASDSTFSDLWKCYSVLKSASWSTATRNAVTSIFSGHSKKKAHPSVVEAIGYRRVSELTRGTVQEFLNQMATRGDSYSAVKKARTYLAAAMEYARDERLITDNSARKLELPTQLLRKPSERYYSLEEVRRLLSEAHGREHLVLRIFLNCGLRPGELFALREDDIEPGQIKIDEAVKEVERGAKRIGETKTSASRAYVGIGPGLQEELDIWIRARRQQCAYHVTASASSSDLLFPTETGTSFRLGNYLKRYLKPLAKKAGIADMTYQALRRTCATHFQKHARPRDIQAQLRHSKLEMTGRYIKEIPDQVRAAVDRMDRELCHGTEQKGTRQ